MAGVQLRQRARQLPWLETEWAWFALVDNPPVRVDQVNAVRPAGVSSLRRIAEFVEHCGKLQAQFAHAGSGNHGSFFFIFRTGENYFVLKVTFHLPDIAGMGLCNVDDQEFDPVPVLLVELVEGGSLPPKRRSSVAAKHEHDGLLRIERCKLDFVRPVKLRQRKIWRGIAYMQASGAGSRPHRFEWIEKKGHRPRHLRHHAAELFWSLVHAVPDENAESEVHDGQAQRRTHNNLFDSLLSIDFHTARLYGVSIDFIPNPFNSALTVPLL